MIAKLWRSLLLAFTLLLAAGTVFALLPAGTFSISGIQHYQQLGRDFYAQHPLQTMAAYFAIYVIFTALSIPGSVLLTLLGGACFHFITGTLLALLALTTGATLAMLFSRYLLRDQIQQRFKASLIKVNKGIAENGIYHLFALRLLPLLPFFVVNLLMGLTHLPARQFFWVTLLGRLPSTLIYVNAGQQLANLTHLSDIFSGPMLMTFALLGALPLISRWAINRLMSR